MKCCVLVLITVLTLGIPATPTAAAGFYRASDGSPACRGVVASPWARQARPYKPETSSEPPYFDNNKTTGGSVTLGSHYGCLWGASFPDGAPSFIHGDRISAGTVGAAINNIRSFEPGVIQHGILAAAEALDHLFPNGVTLRVTTLPAEHLSAPDLLLTDKYWLLRALTDDQLTPATGHLLDRPLPYAAADDQQHIIGHAEQRAPPDQQPGRASASVMPRHSARGTIQRSP
jgi:hypothetical protein